MSARFLIVIVLFCRQILVFTGVVLGIQLLGISLHLTGAHAAAPNTSKSRVQELERLLARARAELATCNEALGIAVAEIASLKAESAATASALAASQAELNDTKSTLAARDAELAACKAALEKCDLQTSRSLPDTEQTKCYDPTGGGGEVPCDSAICPGQDGFYRTGCPSEGRFIDNGDGTVTDNCTGLMWQKDTADTNADGIGVNIDRGVNTDPADAILWCEALEYCENLSFAGHDDWRLPNVRELESIIDYQLVDPSIDPVFRAFPSWFWSSTTGPSFPGSAFIVNFQVGMVSDGVLNGRKRDAIWFVRAVRGAETKDLCTERFHDNGDGTATDMATGLMWQKDTADVSGDGKIDSADTIPWNNAGPYCENLSFAGHDDWRLPKQRELFSIIDVNRIDPAIDPVFSVPPPRPDSTRLWYWSSMGDGPPDIAWYVEFNSGTSTAVLRAGSLAFVRAVRSGP